MPERLEIVIAARDQASKVFRQVGDTLNTAFKAGTVAAAAGVGLLAAGLGKAVQEAMEAERIQAELAAVLASTGGVAGVTADMVNELAAAWMRQTTFSDDAIVSAQTMLLTFTNISRDVFPQALEATLNLATKFGNLEQASVMVGKALHDPLTGLTALRRAGVLLSEQQEQMIRNFMAQGDIMSAQRVILSELETQFGGLAVAAGDTLAGKLTILRNQLDDVFESVGMALLPVLTQAVDTLTLSVWPAVEGFGERLVNLIEQLRALGLEHEHVRAAFEQAFGAELGALLLTTTRAFAELATTVRDFVQQTLIPLASEHAEALKGALLALGAVFGGAAVLGAVQSLTTALLGLTSALSPPLLAVMLLGAAWGANFGGMRDAVHQTAQALEERNLQGTLEGIGLALAAIPRGIAAWIGAQVGIDVPEGLRAWSGVIANIKVIVATLPRYIASLAESFLTITVPTALNDLRAVLDTILRALSAIPRGIAAWVGAQAGINVPEGLRAWRDIIANIKLIIATLPRYIAGMVESFFTIAVPGALNDLRSVLDIVLRALSAIPAWVDALVARLGSITVPDALRALQTVFQTTADAVGSLVSLIGGLISKLNELSKLDLGALGGALDVIGGVAGKLGLQSGGMVGAWQPRVVGERGPELFVPTTPGLVVPHGRLAVGDTHYHLTIISNASTERVLSDFSLLRRWAWT